MLLSLFSGPLVGCKTPPPDLSQQKLVQVAVLLSYDHPSAYRSAREGLKRATAELSQVNAVIFGAPPERSRRDLTRKNVKQQPEVKPGLGTSYRKHAAWKKQQISQIIADGYDVLVLFGDEILDLDQKLLEAQEAGLIVVYCGFAGKPLVARNALARQSMALQRYKSPKSPYDYPARGKPQSSILSQSAARGQLLDENYDGNPIDTGDAPLPYISPQGEVENYPVDLAQETRKNWAQPGLVQLNIRPASIEAVVRSFTQFVQGTTADRAGTSKPRREDQAGKQGTADGPLSRNIREEGWARPHPKTLVLFGPDTLPFTQNLYRKMRSSIIKNRDSILRVLFLDPWHLNSQEQLRRLVLELPADGRIIALEPLLLYSSSQILQRYGLGIKIAGLGWQDLSSSLLASGNIQFLVPLEYKALAYAAIHAAFALYSGQKQGIRGEYFLLGTYGQRQLGEDGSLILHNYYSSTQNEAPSFPDSQEYPRPARVPKNPNRRSILSKEDLRH